ncbi:MAG: hypothetical protein R3F11_05825 [Verrucomicrobiales bacterium]
MDPWHRWLESASFPPRSRLYLFDNSGDPAFSARLRDCAIALSECGNFERAHLHIRRNPAPVPPRHNPERHWNVADAYNSALFASGKNEAFVFLLVDDTIPPPDCLPKLAAAFAELETAGERPGAISGSYESATNRGFLVAGRSMLGWEKRVRIDELETNDIIRVGMAGAGCLLIRGDLFWDFFPIRGESMGGVLGPDSYICAEVHRRGYSVWLHGGVICDHLSARRPAESDPPPENPAAGGQAGA